MTNLEICINCDSPQPVHDSVHAAFAGSATTIELCRALSLDGLTPTAADIISARHAFQNNPITPIHAAPQRSPLASGPSTSRYAKY